VKYLNKSFSLGGPRKDYYDSAYFFTRISKGEWVIMPGAGRERYIPEGKPIPPEATTK
jgi:hypothetical protein